MNTHKFGGAFFVHSEEAKRVVSLIAGNQEQNIFVCSAKGKGTRLLQEIYNDVLSFGVKNGKSIEIISKLRKMHYSMIENFFGNLEQNVVNDFVNDEKRLIALLLEFSERSFSDSDLAKVLQFGELFSSRIFYNYLCKEHGEENVAFIDARSFMKTKPSGGAYPFSQANFSIEESLHLLGKTFSDPTIMKKKFIVTQGYISRDFETGMETTLGFDASDLTASFIGMLKGVEKIYWWKDVLGVYEDVHHSLIFYKFLTTQDYLDLASRNNGEVPVLPGAIKLLQGLNKEKYVRSFLDLDCTGTRIF